jgi:PST family polysaccharide transporter
MRGSAFLAFRQGFGVVISLGGILLLTRLIGPEAYGLFAAAHTILAYLVAVSEAGLGVYLIRMAVGEEEEAFDQAFTLLLVLSLAGVLLTAAALPLLARLVPLDGIRTAILALVLGLPLVHLTKVPMARLEHHLDYRRVAFIELAGLGVYYAVALPLAFRGWKVGAPIAGWWGQFATQFLLAYRTGYHPRLRWNRPLIRRMLSYGLSYSVSLWIQQLRTFVNPVVVGRFAGAAGVGYVALALRLVEQLGFVKTVTARISIAALARLHGDPARLARAMAEGMTLQLLAAGPLLIAFGLIAPWLIPRVFGPRWLPVLEVFPLLAVSYLAASMFLLHSSTLIVLGRNREVAIFSLAGIVVLAGAALLLVPALGVAGYGWAEVAVLPTYLVLHHYVATRAAPPPYRLAAIWAVAFAVPLLTYRWITCTWPIALLPLLIPPVRRQVAETARLLLRRVRPERDAEPVPEGAVVAAHLQEEGFRP